MPKEKNATPISTKERRYQCFMKKGTIYSKKELIIMRLDKINIENKIKICA